MQHIFFGMLNSLVMNVLGRWHSRRMTEQFVKITTAYMNAAVVRCEGENAPMQEIIIQLLKHLLDSQIWYVMFFLKYL